MSVDAFLRALSATLPTRAICTEHELIAPWLTDWRGRWSGRSAALLQPSSTEEVATIVRLADEHGVALVPQGGNTSMVGGATPPNDGSAVLLSLRKMHRIRSICTGAAVVEAGMILADLHEIAGSSGQRFPLTLGARGSATVGGLAATNAGGTQVLRFGTMRTQVLGIEAVLAGGLVYDGTGGLKKDTRGLSIDQLLIGSEGTLGVITAVRLRLVPAIAARGVAWLGLSSPEDASALLAELVAASDRIEGFEIMPATCVQTVLAHIPGARSPIASAADWHVLVELTADTAECEAPSETLARLLSMSFSSGLISDGVIAASEAHAEAFWRIRDSISEAERNRGPAATHDISVAPERMAQFMTAAARKVQQRFQGTEAFGFGHLGDGNVHFQVRAPADAAPNWTEGTEGKAVSAMVHSLVTEWGGSISAEHGIGQMKREDLERLATPARLNVLRAVKGALDPKGLFNPGKIIGPALPSLP